MNPGELWFVDGVDLKTGILNVRHKDGKRWLIRRQWDGRYEILRPDHALWFWELYVKH